MLKIGRLELGTIPRIAVPLSDVDVRELARTPKAHADIFELRIDTFQQHDPAYVVDVCREAAAHDVPLIATIRIPDEGGRTAISDPDRRAIFEAVAPLVDALDVEFHARIYPDVIAIAHRHHKRVIVSSHDFHRTPLDKDLLAVILTAKRHGADIVKLAVTAQTAGDIDRLVGVLREHRAKQIIVIALGPRGTMSRVFFPLLGSVITYGYLREANAPGQLSLDDLARDLSRYCPDFAAEKAAS